MVKNVFGKSSFNLFIMIASCVMEVQMYFAHLGEHFPIPFPNKILYSNERFIAAISIDTAEFRAFHAFSKIGVGDPS